MRILVLLLLPVFFNLLISCSSVKIDRGPFEINPNDAEILAGHDLLNTISSDTIRNSRPNILLILVDDLAKYDLSLYGQQGVSTPHLEKLAREGMLFTHAYTSSPVCSPSRAALLTGRYQQRFGFERQPMNRYSRNRVEYFFVDHLMNVEPMRLLEPMAKVPAREIEHQGIPESEILLSEILQSVGYKTGICGKWHLGNAEEFRPNQRGFEYQYGFYEAFTLYSPENSEGIVEHRHDYFANKHIWKQQREGPCAIRVNDSIIEEEEYLTFAIARESIAFIEKNKETPFFLLSAFNAPHTPFQVPIEYFEKFPEEKDHNKRTYYAMIAALDDAIGMVMDALSEQGIEENTLVFFVSDNGGAEYTGATDNGPLKGGKFTQFEGGVNVPMIMKWDQRISAGTVCENQVSLMDIMPTILSAASVQIEDKLKIDGAVLTDNVLDENSPVHDYLFWRTDFNKAIRSSEWKMIWNVRDEEVFLYSLSENNFEEKNLAEERPDIVAKLKEIYSDWEREMQDPLWPGVMEYRYETEGQETWWAI